MRGILTLAILSATLATNAGAQIINDWDKRTGDVVTSVEEGSIGEDDYSATGILETWGELEEEFRSEAMDELESELDGIGEKGGRTAGTVTLTTRDGRELRVPTVPSGDGTDMFLLTRDGISIYMAVDAPAYHQETDDETVRWIRFYARKRRKTTLAMFRRYETWEPRIKSCFRAEGIPEELAELCLVESACTYKALSPAGALGMWQIMPATGRRYGMAINGSVDERTDPVASTMVAARILKDNMKATGDWTLATAAYNCGAGRVGRMRDGKIAGSWEQVRTRLPEETRQYIPRLLALHYVWTYREKLGLA